MIARLTANSRKLILAVLFLPLKQRGFLDYCSPRFFMRAKNTEGRRFSEFGLGCTDPGRRLKYFFAVKENLRDC